MSEKPNHVVSRGYPFKNGTSRGKPVWAHDHNKWVLWKRNFDTMFEIVGVFNSPCDAAMAFERAER